jgi:hypothetical protein
MVVHSACPPSVHLPPSLDEKLWRQQMRQRGEAKCTVCLCHAEPVNLRLVPGAALVILSRGIVEAEYGGDEFGLERAGKLADRGRPQRTGIDDSAGGPAIHAGSADSQRCAYALLRNA